MGVTGNEAASNVFEAYIVLRDGARWHDVYKLTPGFCLSVGRDSTNRIIIADDRCSRRHCELFFGPGGWRIRDLRSSNGTQVNGVAIEGQLVLEDGDVVRVGSTELLYTLSFDRQLSPEQTPPMIESDTDSETQSDDASDTEAGINRVAEHGNNDDDDDEAEILEQKSRGRYQEVGNASLLRHDFADLYRLSSAMLGAEDVKSLAQVVLEGLTQVLTSDIGAVLLLPEPAIEVPSLEALRLIAYQAPDDMPYHRVSDRVSSVALRSGDGALALSVTTGLSGGSFQTLEDMKARSVICVPIRAGELTFGLIHQYSVTPEQALDGEALEFTLAVAEHMAGILAKMHLQQNLAAGLEQARSEAKSLRQMLAIESDLIGNSGPMQKLRDEIGSFAVSTSTALIRGESGVGKELVARAIHFNSPRRDQSIVCMNCAAISESLLESELFGHEKGAFTGATERKIGKFEQAHGGTLFLDEIGEMSPHLQAKFLRVLEGQPFERVGGTRPIEVDVRVVAATNRDLEQAVRDNDFRKDLFFRLNILDIEVPPLRKRRDDIPVLAQHFMELCARKQGQDPKKLLPEVLDDLQRYDWPGNVRELRNTIERAFAVSRGDEICSDAIRFSRLQNDEADPVIMADEYRPLSIRDIEEQHIRATLQFTKWVKRETARILGIERSTLDRKLKAYDINKPED